MGILDIHTDSMLQAGVNTAYLPPPKPTQKFSAWSTTTALPRGVTAGVAESTGMWADIVGAFGQVMAASGGGMDMFGNEIAPGAKKQEEAARQKMLNEGIDYTSEAGSIFRDVARSYRPDAATAHAAEEVVFGFAKFASKAVGYSMAGGPVVGAGLTGADEAMQASDDLRLQGVDLGTRTAAGLAQGAGAALGVALPVAGKTLAQTVGLVAAGGPLSFVGQQAATRQILDSAGYSRIGMQYDPFDPVGLAVATLVPAGFGAWGLRGARRRAAEAQRVETEAAEVAPRETVTEEQVDAARVQFAMEEQRRSSLAAPDDFAGQAQHDAALARAAEQLAAGERVDVGDVAPSLVDAPALREWAAEVERVFAQSRNDPELGVRSDDASPDVISETAPGDPHAEARAAVDQLAQNVEEATGLPAKAVAAEISNALGVEPKPQTPEQVRAVVELRKRESVLRQLLECIA